MPAESTNDHDPAAHVLRAYRREFAAAVATTAASPPPALHLFNESGYDGSIVCRPHQPGRDTANAITSMGWIAAARNATRLLLVWEDAMLRLNLQGPGVYDRCLIALDVHLTGTPAVTYYPFTMTQAPPTSIDVIGISWETPLYSTTIGPPPPMAELLALWRANHGRLDAAATLATAHANDYITSFAVKSAV